MISMMDCNNFWSPTGGGVRRYHLQKIEYFSHRSDIHYVFVMQDDHNETEQINDTTFIEHIVASKFPGNWEYRFLLSHKPLVKLLFKHKPDVIEVGSPYIMPFLVRKAKNKVNPKIRVHGFWHADFPVTYVGRFFRKFGENVGSFFENLAWWYAFKSYGWMDQVQVSSQFIENRMKQKGFKNTVSVPLGVDTVQFHPSKKDSSLVKELKAGSPNRLSIFFPHRFQEEKGVRTLLQAYPILCKKLECEPALIFAGTGPDLELVQSAVKQYKHIQYLGFIKSRDEMARWMASCELGLALSGWETFGLSILESMASGQMLIGANTGAAKEHVINSGAGEIVAPGNASLLAEVLARVAQSQNRDKGAKKARTYAERFSWDHCFQREIEISL